MFRTFTIKMQNEVNAVVDSAAASGLAVRVYAEAEQIRRANLADNIALEDIVEAIIDRSGDKPGCEFDPDEARDALLGTTSGLVH